MITYMVIILYILVENCIFLFKICKIPSRHIILGWEEKTFFLNVQFYHPNYLKLTKTKTNLYFIFDERPLCFSYQAISSGQKGRKIWPKSKNQDNFILLFLMILFHYTNKKQDYEKI